VRLNPDTHNLLATALDEFRAQMLPHIAPEQRYTALMIANALAMTQRDLDAAASGARAFQAAMAALYGDSTDVAAEQLESRFAADIEAGAFDAPSPNREAAFRCLQTLIAAKLAITNPKLVREERWPRPLHNA